MIYNFGNKIVNNYMIPYESGWLLIDTGYAGGFPRFKRLLNKSGVDEKDIRYIFLTHAHDDHAGFLNEVLSATNAKVILHPKAIEGLKRGQNSFKGGCSTLLAYLFCQILALFGHGDHHYPPIREEYLSRLITIDSEEFKSMHFPYKVVETPGHTADHISLLAGDKFFVGDAAMNNFPSIKRTIIWIEDLNQYKHSWYTILDKGLKMTLYPAHGKPFESKDLQKYLPNLDNIKLHPLSPRNKKN